MVAELSGRVEEIFPWDLTEEIDSDRPPLLLDIRCESEFEQAHIEGSLSVPRGILEIAVDYGYDETVPELAEARDRRVVVICRSGNRSMLAGRTLQLLGFRHVASLKTGLRGWNDYEQPMVDGEGRELDADDVDTLFTPRLSPAQMGPQRSRAA
ncbi:MAG: rhodanese-like domain-containing protein [Chromatiales bacterium]|nr:rhodanese-like domain-containing protein [Chromatiales bacterium]